MDCNSNHSVSFRGKSLPLNEENKIKTLHQSGWNFKEISLKTGISSKTVSKYICGQVTETPKRQYQRDIMTEEVMTCAEFYKQVKPSITYPQIRRKLVEDNICDPQNVPSKQLLSYSFIHDLGYYKKIQQIPLETQGDATQIHFDNFMEFISEKNPNSLHFFDESSVIRTSGNRNYGTSVKGTRAYEQQRYASNANYTINLLHSRFGVDYFNVLDGPSNSMELINFFSEVVDLNFDKMANGFPPIFIPGDVVIMDNCAFHHSNIVNNHLPQLLRQAGVTVKFQPPYHPQLNTCEYCFHIIKQNLRSDSDFTYHFTRTAISDAIIDGITIEKSENIFKHCGYIR